MDERLFALLEIAASWLSWILFYAALLGVAWAVFFVVEGARRRFKRHVLGRDPGPWFPEPKEPEPRRRRAR